jgi:hypothetical protein
VVSFRDVGIDGRQIFLWLTVPCRFQNYEANYPKSKDDATAATAAPIKDLPSLPSDADALSETTYSAKSSVAEIIAGEVPSGWRPRGCPAHTSVLTPRSKTIDKLLVRQHSQGRSTMCPSSRAARAKGLVGQVIPMVAAVRHKHPETTALRQ